MLSFYNDPLLPWWNLKHEENTPNTRSTWTETQTRAAQPRSVILLSFRYTEEQGDGVEQGDEMENGWWYFSSATSWYSLSKQTLRTNQLTRHLYVHVLMTQKLRNVI